MMTIQDFQRRWSGYTPGLLGGSRRFAVLVPLTDSADGPRFLFEVRDSRLSQGGEICFPGGRSEPEEPFTECALRETWEELSIPREEITLLGQSDYLVHQRGFLLQPVLGAVSPAGMAAMRPSPNEVAEVFTVPVEFFRSTPPLVLRYALEPRLPEDFPYEAVGIGPDYPWGGGEVEFPVWNYHGRIIWGMTARILRDILLHMD